MKFFKNNKGIFQENIPITPRRTTSTEKVDNFTPFLKGDFKFDSEIEDNSMEYFILNTIYLVLKANVK